MNVGKLYIQIHCPSNGIVSKQLFFAHGLHFYIYCTWRTQLGLKLPQIIKLDEQSTSLNVFDITDEFRPRDETLHSLFHNH